MSIIKSLKQRLRKHENIYFYLNQVNFRAKWFLLGDEKITLRKYRKIFGKELDLNNPVTLNDKIQFLKIYNHEDFHTCVSDKYAARKWLSDRFGTEYLVPLIYSTDNFNDIKPENIREYPCIIKANNGCGSYHIIRDPKAVDWNLIRCECKRWLKTNYYYASQEWQYKNIKPMIIVEKLLVTKEGKIPNDYKLHYINGKLEFIYCSVDRENGNFRNIYDEEWKPLDFIWIAPSKVRDNIRGPEIEKPKSFEKMKEIGEIISRDFPYVRVDFYDVDGKLYYGEITLHHGGGYDIFIPDKWDLYYGNKLDIGSYMERRSM